MYFDRLVKSLYGSLMKPNGFVDFLTELSTCLNLRSGVVTMFNHKVSSAEVVWVEGLDLVKALEYMRRYGHRDVLMKSLLLAPVGQLIVMGDEDMMRMKQTDPECVQVLNDFGVYYAAAAILGHDDNWTSRLYFQRNKKQGRFTEKECLLIERLLPHIQHALQLYHFKMDTEQQHFLSHLLFEQIRLPVILLNEAGDISHCNGQAKQLLNEHQYLQEVDMKLSWLHAKSDAKLQQSIENCLKERSTNILPLGDELSVQVVLAFVPLIVKESHDEYGLAVFVYNERCLPINKKILAELYHLSDKETLVCCELIAGKSPAEIADVTFLSYQTVRTYIKRVMQKTETNRQCELVAKILGSPACNLIDHKIKLKR